MSKSRGVSPPGEKKENDLSKATFTIGQRETICQRWQGSSFGGFRNGCRGKFLCDRLSAQVSFPSILRKQGDQGYPFIARIPIPPFPAVGKEPARVGRQRGWVSSIDPQQQQLGAPPPPPRPTDIRVLSVQVVRGFIPWGFSGHCYFPQWEGEKRIDPTQRFPGVLFADLLVNPREEWETEE